ncbi:MAG: FAD-dependent oxidoreductase [Burkholderiales bacterium]
MSDKHDVIIIGGGIGGLVAGALLAKYEHRKVLVLEKQRAIGGRCLSFGGPHGRYTADEYRAALKGAAALRLVHCEPSLETIVDEYKLFDNFIIDPGWHLVTGAHMNRYSLLAEAMGKRIDVLPQRGLYIDIGVGEFGELSQMTKDWPEASKREHKRVARERMQITMEESKAYDHIDLVEYLESVTPDQRVRDYYSWLGRFLLALNDARACSAGEFIRTNNMPVAAGLHLSRGGGSGEVVGGFKRIADTFAEIIQENGGTVLTNAPVHEIVLDGNVATGVKVTDPTTGRTETLEAETVICNIPLDAIGKVLPMASFPAELRERIGKIHSATGVTGFICVDRLPEPDKPEGVFVVDPLPGAPVIKGGGAVVGFEQTTALDTSRRLGKDHYIQTWIVVSTSDPDEAHDEPLIQKLVQAQLAWFRNKYPGFAASYKWSIFGVADRIYGISPEPGMIGDRRPPVKHPLVKNLYFTGDTVAQTDVGTSGAVHGAMLCAGEVAGHDFMQLLPDFLR